MSNSFCSLSATALSERGDDNEAEKTALSVFAPFLAINRLCLEPDKWYSLSVDRSVPHRHSFLQGGTSGPSAIFAYVWQSVYYSNYTLYGHKLQLHNDCIIGWLAAFEMKAKGSLASIKSTMEAPGSWHTSLVIFLTAVTSKMSLFVTDKTESHFNPLVTVWALMSHLVACEMPSPLCPIHVASCCGYSCNFLCQLCRLLNVLFHCFEHLPPLCWYSPNLTLVAIAINRWAHSKAIGFYYCSHLLANCSM